jgi:hypothetical protein
MASVTQCDGGVASKPGQSYEGKEAGANVMSHVMLNHKPIATKYILKLLCTCCEQGDQASRLTTTTRRPRQRAY